MNRIQEQCLLKISHLASRMCLTCLILLAIPFWACSDMIDTPVYSVKKAFIKSFKINGISGNIDISQKTIKIYFQDEVDLSAVTPEITLPKGATYSPEGAVDLTKPVKYTVTFGEEASSTEYIVEAVVGEGNKVEVDVNRVFFSPCGTLRNHAIEGITGDESNSGQYYDYTYNWRNETDSLVWGIDVVSPGELKIVPKIGVPEAQSGSIIELIIGKEKREITLESTGGYENFQEQGEAVFDIPKAGRYVVYMRIKSKKSEADVAYVQSLIFSKAAARGMAPVVLRWRPAAIHCGWKNGKNPQNIVMAIHEVTVKSDYIDSYSPITTPFGYFGSTWEAANERFGGINFSLWSFAAGATPPSVEKFSHLIAVGEGGSIGGFNHEGTGVKRRGDNPYLSMTGERTQVLALKKVPGTPYDTYYSYYWDTNDKKWILYGCGKKYNDQGISYLTTGAFVEQPGGPDAQRSNHVKREIHFRGWYVDDNAAIYPINIMTTTKLEETTYKNWGKTDDGRFVMQMGGFDQILTERPDEISITSVSEQPEYLSEEHLKELGRLPIEIVTKDPTEITATSVKVNFELSKFGTNPTIKLYWGKTDGLTFVEDNVGNGGVVKWDSYQAIQPTATSFSHKIEGLMPETKYYYRLQVVNQEGETWSWESGTFTTTEGEPEKMEASLSFVATEGHISQEGNIVSFDPYESTVSGNFIVNKPVSYPWANLKALAENDDQVTNMHFSLDGTTTELAVPSSKARGNFIVMSIAPSQDFASDVFNTMELSWNDKMKNELFAGNYVTCGGFLQYDLIFDLYDTAGNKIVEIADTDPNTEGDQPKYATAVVTLKCLNKNENAKCIHMLSEPQTITRPTAAEGTNLVVGYDAAKSWKEAFGSDMPEIKWTTKYWTSQGLFKKTQENGECAYRYCAEAWGKPTIANGLITLNVTNQIEPGEYVFRIIAQVKANLRQYAIYEYPFIVK